MEEIMNFFDTNSILETIYWLLAIASSGFLGLKILFNFIGLDLDYDLDLDFDTGFSLSTLTGFLSAGSWTGILAYKMTSLTDGFIVLAAGIAGIIGFAGSFFVLKKLKTIETSGNILIENAIGKTGKVYLHIPKNGIGQVEVIIQSRLKIMDAVSANGEKINTGEEVFIFDIQNNRLVVEKTAENQISEK